MDADPTKYGVPPGRPPTGDPANVAVCSGCQRPLTRTRPGGECLRCLFGFALSPDEEPAAAVSVDEAAASAPGRQPSLAAPPLRYGQFEVAMGFDGLPVELGAGAMAVTYRARDTVLDSDVALKVINRTLAGHPDARARFLREARAAARLHHPNVASVSHYGEQDGECYYAMELVEGETLEARVRRDGPLPVALAIEVGVQVARALAAAEACGVVHRDLKPSNLMLSARQGDTGEADALMVKVIDWGLAKAVSAESALGADHTRGAFIGTPAFASPEQFAANAEGGRRIDARADIYSLGVTLWYLLCGRTPFGGRTLEEIHARQVHGPLPVERLSAVRVPGQVIALLRSMLAVDPAARPQSARELLAALRRCQERFPAALPPAASRRRRLRRLTAALGLLAALLATAAAAWWYHARPPVAPMDRSIAVLPFENLSPEKADAFFTVGVQASIADDLAHVASLKVIGPDSTRLYPPENRDLARIGRELGTGHLLEGSVRRAGERVAVTVRLVNARNQATAWTKQYDRRLADVFAVQSEIARAVADRLQVNLSPGEKAAINELPTSDLAAYDLYLRSREGPTLLADEAEQRQDDQRKVALLEKAIARDPTFALAYCDLARAHDDLHFYRAGATAEELAIDHRALAEAALATARRLRPDAGEVHLAHAYHFHVVLRDYAQARLEGDLARRALPNNAEVEDLAGRIARAQNRWEDAIHCQEQAAALEPRDRGIRYDLARTYQILRRYEDFERTMAGLIAITPAGELGSLPLELTMGALEGRADLAPLRAALARLSAANDPEGRVRDRYSLILHLAEHDAPAVSRVLAASKQSQFVAIGLTYPKAWFEGLAARMRGDAAGARDAFAAARPEVEKLLLADPTDGRTLSLLAMVDAGLGRQDAVAEARRAGALTTSTFYGPIVGCNLAVVYAWTGQPDFALTELEKWVTLPAGGNLPAQPTCGDFRLNPVWDPLRNDPRFEALVERLAPSVSR